MNQSSEGNAQLKFTKKKSLCNLMHATAHNHTQQFFLFFFCYHEHPTNIENIIIHLQVQKNQAPTLGERRTERLISWIRQLANGHHS